MTGGAPTDATEALAGDAPAKVNLALHVTGRRDDGYHLLDTLAVFTELGDRLECSPAAETGLEVSGRFAEALSGADDNLVLQAAAALHGRGAGERRFRLTKNLPVAAGIGGGSADAAAALRLLSGLCEPVPSAAELARIALSLGADVPMCLESVALRARGIGEEIERLPDLPEFPLVLVNPGVAVPTGAIFRELGGRFGGELPDPGRLRDLQDVLCWLSETSNDLEVPAIEVEPAVGEALAELQALPTCLFARMSGSGATCFAVFADSAQADVAARQLRLRQPGWWIEPTMTRSVAPAVFRSGG